MNFASFNGVYCCRYGRERRVLHQPEPDAEIQRERGGNQDAPAGRGQDVQGKLLLVVTCKIFVDLVITQLSRDFMQA